MSSATNIAPTDPTPGLTVAVLGTGTMGAGMARSLLRKGFDVRVWNRTPKRAAPLADDGARVAGSPGEAVDGADAVLVMMYDLESVLETLEKLTGAVDSDAVVLQTSTIGPAGMSVVGDSAADHGWKLLDTPVLGTKQPAEEGKLVVLASGDAALREQVQPVFDAIGSRTVWVGDDLGQASALKLACNSWVAASTAAAAQAVALARGAGLDPQLLLDALGGGPSDSAYLQMKGQAMIEEKFPVAFALDGVRKDVDLMIDMAHDRGVGAPLLDSLRSIFAAAAAKGYGQEDLAAVVKAF